MISGDTSATACVATKAGSFFDPPKYPGLAHLVEHLLWCAPYQVLYFECLWQGTGFDECRKITPFTISTSVAATRMPARMAGWRATSSVRIAGP